MPPGILYLHGGVHYNGGWLLFNDFKEAIGHFSDPKFAAEFRRFVREQRREPVTPFRDRDYDRAEFAKFVCFMRTIFPWFSNSNGPKICALGQPGPLPCRQYDHGELDYRLPSLEVGRRPAHRRTPAHSCAALLPERPVFRRAFHHAMAGASARPVHRASHRPPRRTGESVFR